MLFSHDLVYLSNSFVGALSSNPAGQKGRIALRHSVPCDSGNGIGGPRSLQGFYPHASERRKIPFDKEKAEILPIDVKNN